MADDGQPPVTQIMPEEQELGSSGELQNLSTHMFFGRIGFLENEELLPLNLGRFGQLGSFAGTSAQDWQSDVGHKPKLGPHWTSHYGKNLFAAAASSDPNTSGFSMNPDVSGDVDTPPTDDNEQEAPVKEEKTEEDKKYSQMGLADLLPQMMFVSGETAEPSIDTTTLIEEITRQQVIEIVRTLFVSPVN